MALTAVQRAIEAAKATANKVPAVPTPTPYKSGTNPVVPKAGYTPPTTTPTPYTGTSTPDMTKINANAAQTASNSPTIPVNYAPVPQTGMSSIQSPTPTPTPTVNTPQPQTGLYQDPYARSREDIAKLAADRIAKILQAGRTSASGALEGAKNAYNYTNQIEGDNRTLRNAEFKETNNPFSGNTSYMATNMLRNDTIQDTAQDKDYNAQVGLINQKLADLEAAAPGDEQAIIDQLEQIERQTGISVAQLQEQQKNNQFNNGMQQKQFNQQQQVIDYNQNPNNPNNIGQSLNNAGQALANQLNELKLGNYSTEQKQQATLFEQQVKAGQMSNEAAEYNLKQLKDPNSAANQISKLDLQMKQLEAKNLPEQQKLELQQLKKQIAQIGVVHYKPQSAAEIAQDKVTLATANKQLADIANGKYPGDKVTQSVTAEEYQKNLKPRYDSENVLTNAQQIEDQIILSGMSEYEQYRAYRANGLTWDDPIPTK